MILKAKLVIIFLWLFSAECANGQLPACGLASYYGKRANHHRTASGEKLSNDSFTAAFRTYPFGTYLKVTNLKNKHIAIVRINDRGPHRRKRIIDLSYAAARKIRLMNSGIAQVEVDLATDAEIKDRKIINTDSAANDSAVKGIKQDSLKALVDDAKIYMIQAGIFSLKNSAYNLEKYLNHKNVPGVSVTRLHFKGRDCYKVSIGPLNTSDKETALKWLRAKHIKGLVSKLKTHHKTKR